MLSDNATLQSNTLGIVSLPYHIMPSNHFTISKEIIFFEIEKLLMTIFWQ